MLKRLTLGLLILFSGWNLFGQDPSFSQFYANPLYLNPAYTGSTYCGRLILNFRDQWPSISNGYVTYSASYDQSLEKVSSGYGIMFMGDRQGDGAISTMMISGLYSYKLKVSESVNVDFGVQATYNQMKMDWDKFVFGDMIDPNNGSSTLPTHENSANWNTSINYIDFSFGVLAGYEDKLFGGVAVQHINEPDNGLNIESDSQLPMKITANVGSVINLSTGRIGGGDDGDITISPNLLYQQQGTFKQMNVGLYGNINPFVVGVWYRSNFDNPDAVIALVGFKQPTYRIGYSYDITVSQIGLDGGGAHEISFAWEFCVIREDFKRRRIKTIKSPTF